MNSELKVLVVEDSEEDYMLLTRALRRLPFELHFHRVDTAEALLSALETRDWDIVISDYAMPRFDGISALRLVRERAAEIPFLLVSGTVGEEVAVTAMKAGAQDYVMKDNLTRLAPAVERELREAELRREHLKAQQAIREIDERNRAIITAAADGIITFDEQGIIESFNPAAERIFGYVPADAIGGCLSDLLPELRPGALIPESYDASESLPGDDSSLMKQMTGLRKDGSTVPVEIAISKVRVGDRGLFTGIAHDITERKESERRIRRQLERLHALRTVDTAILGSLNLQVTLSVILSEVLSTLAGDAADFLLVNPATQMLEYVAGRGFATGEITRTRLPLGQGCAGRAASERVHVSIPDLGADEPEFDRASLVTAEEFGAYYAVPLIAKGAVVGVLEIFWRAAVGIDQEWIDFIDALSGQSAIAIENGRLFEELQQANADLVASYDRTLEGWVKAVDLRDHETEGHTQRVTGMTLRLAKEMGLSDTELVHVKRGALLHDIGKIGVPDVVLLKPGQLTEEEWTVMRKHPGYAYEWLAPISYLHGSLGIPYCHHEKWDGSGYPRGLAGEDIPLEARIFAVVDVWDALLSDRPYRKGWPLEQVLEHIRAAAGSHFDPQVVMAFLKLLSGTEVLSTLEDAA